MNFATKAASAVGSFAGRAFTAMRHAAAATGLLALLKRTRFDYKKEVGDGLDSSVVTAPIRWVQRALPEARLVAQKRKPDGSTEELLGHEMLALIQRPNDHYGDIALWAATVLSWFLDGNAYWLKIRNSYGKVVELWYVPHWLIEPIEPREGDAFIDHYRYSPGKGEQFRIDPADVVHFRDGIDPRNIRKGLGALVGVLREIFMDLEASNFVASLLRNMGVPSVVISPKAGVMVRKEDAEATKAWYQQAFGGDNRGGALVLGAPTDVQPYGFNPQQMNMSEARDVAEERVCAVMGIPAAVVGFGAGLQTSKVGATMSELHRIAWTNGVLPVARALADELKRSLLPEFERDPAKVELVWNTDEVLALQEDEAKQDERWNKRLQSGGITLFEYRVGIGMDADDSHRIYLRPISVLEVPEGAAGRSGSGLPGPKTFGAKGRRASEDAYARGHAYALLLQRQAPGLEEAFEKRLKARFASWGKAGRAAALSVLEEPKSADEKGLSDLVEQILEKLGITGWLAELVQDYGAHYLDVANAVNDAAERAGLGTNLPDPVARAIVASGGRRVGLLDLDKQSRDAVYHALAEGRAEGEGVEALADRIALDIEAGPWSSGEIRARLIARTETKFAQNVSTIERARAAGVGTLIVFDGRLGPGRSLESHIARNGSIVTIEAGLTMADEEHPNGTLSFAPNFEE